MSRPHIRTEWPWIRSAPLFKVHADAVGELEELGRAFGFPDWSGPSWDGSNDCMGHFVTEHDGALVAVVWSHADVAVRVAPTVAIEMDVFVTGSTPDFDRPPQNS